MNLSKSQSERKQGKPSDLRYTLKASRGKRCIIYDPSDANNDDFFYHSHRSKGNAMTTLRC